MKRTIAPDVLRGARLAHQFTQQDLAEAMGVGLTTVRSWEAGRRSPSAPLFTKLCLVLHVTPEELTGQKSPHVEAPPFPAPPATQEEQERRAYPGTHQGNENRRRFLANIRRLWIDGVLANSLYQAVLLELGLEELPEAVINPWRFAVQETAAPPQMLPMGTTIAQVYDAAESELLILGEPGAGKTTQLLVLAQALLLRAEQHEDAPMPAIFNLSSWSGKQTTLAEWLIEELHQKYRVPRQVGRSWIEAQELALFLDGLDETPEHMRSSCAKAISAYKQEHDMVPLAVCCRREEYFALASRLPFQKAVVLQPLTRTQIDTYLKCVKGRLEIVQKALQDDRDLKKMVQNPLMLSIISLTYQQDDLLVLQGSPETRRRQVLDAYVQRMLKRRSLSPYQEQQTLTWLAWLARQMKHDQTAFALERMQPTGLPTKRQHQYESLVFRLYYGIRCLVFGAIFSWMRGGNDGRFYGVGEGLLGWLGARPGNSALGWMAKGIGGGIEGGGSLALTLLVITPLLALLIAHEPLFSREAVKAGIRGGAKAGIIGGSIFGLLGMVIFFVLFRDVHESFVRGAGVGIMGGLIAALMPGMMAWLSYDSTPHPFGKQKRPWPTHLFDGLILGVCTFLGFEGVGLLLHLSTGALIADGIILSLGYCFIFCTPLGQADETIQRLVKEIKPIEVVTWSWAQVHRDLGRSLLKGAAIAGIITILTGIVVVGVSGISYGIAYGLRYGLIYGLIIGIVASTAGVLVSILKSGWNSQMLAKHQQLKPNAGILRSAWHGVLAASGFGLVGGLLSGLACALAFGIIGQLATWPILALGFALVMGIEFALTAYFLQGGLAWVEHYVLRWYLQRTGCIPSHYTAFLDFAVEHIFLRRIGGEYMFVHQLLLDYFASLPL